MKVHVFQHVPFEGLGSIEGWLNSGNHRVTYTRFFDSATFPDLGEVELLIVLGGPMGANDDDELPWLRDEKRFIAAAIASGKAVLGVCLGAQLIAISLGARVYPALETEIGWFRIFGMRKIDGAFCFPDQAEVFHWHGDTFDLPRQTIHLAMSKACRNQAFQFGERVIGLQFHLEVTPESVDAMVKACGDGLRSEAFVQSASQMKSTSPARYAAVNKLMAQVLGYLAC